MTIGTKTILFGAHSLAFHPLTLALAWVKLFGPPWNWRLWAAFVLHDLRYFGRDRLEGPGSEAHVELGARIMHAVAGPAWADFTARHSREWSRRHGRPISALCLADKLAFVITPDWLYLAMTRLTGELHEYMERSIERERYNAGLTAEERRGLLSGDQRAWLTALKSYTRRWVEEQRSTLLRTERSRQIRDPIRHFPPIVRGNR